MPYDDLFERELVLRWHHWHDEAWRRATVEERMTPDERFDDIGWDIFYAAVARGMDSERAGRLAMDGNLRQRRLVRSDIYRGLAEDTRRRWRQFHPNAADMRVWETQAPEQLAFWRSRLKSPSFVYFIQSGEHGPVKIGFTSRDPHARVCKLQTGNPEELLLRHVIPAERATEKQLHTRFEPARIRLEWFGGDYLPVILAFAGGLADEMLHAYDGGGRAPALLGGRVLSEGDIARLRHDIERLWLRGHSRHRIAAYTGLSLDDLDDHLAEMRRSTFYDVNRGEAGGPFYLTRFVGKRQRRSATRRAG